MSPRNEDQNKQIRDTRRDQILNAALEQFARKGLAAAKISDIAAAANLSHGLVYHYFKSKDEMFTALVESAMEQWSGVVEFAEKAEGTPLQKIKIMTDILVSALPGRKDAAYYHLIMLQAFALETVPERVKEIKKGPTPAVEYMVKLIMEGQQQGEIVRGNPISLALTYWALLQGLTLMQIQGKGEIPLPDADTVIKILKA